MIGQQYRSIRGGARADSRLRASSGLLHRVQADHVAFGVIAERNEAVWADRELVLHDLAAVLPDAASLDGAVLAFEVDHRAAHPCRTVRHPDERSRRAIAVLA